MYFSKNIYNTYQVANHEVILSLSFNPNSYIKDSLWNSISQLDIAVHYQFHFTQLTFTKFDLYKICCITIHSRSRMFALTLNLLSTKTFESDYVNKWSEFDATEQPDILFWFPPFYQRKYHIFTYLYKFWTLAPNSSLSSWNTSCLFTIQNPNF